MRRTLLLVLSLLLGGMLFAEAALAVERRRDQFPNEPAYLVLPLPYSLPGIGEGWILIGFMANIFEYYADPYFYLITGDATGRGYGIDEIHLIPRTLLLEVFREEIDTAQVHQYLTRGMDTKKDEFVLVDASNVKSVGGSLSLGFLERQLSIYLGAFQQTVLIDAVRDDKGKLQQEYSDPVDFETKEVSYGLRWDNTDDFYDPRKGLRLTLERSNSLLDSNGNVDYYVLETTLNFYIPMGQQSTWVFDYFRSQAIVEAQGETDRAAIADSYCAEYSGIPDAYSSCVSSSENLINGDLDGNRYGTAASLGGRDRLRAYPDGRFQGAQTAYFGTEFRWNLTEEVTPFDYFIWKDVRTGIQLAFFAETGSVAEQEGDLWSRSRSDAGVGFRMITASGGVYRADLANGDEGTETTIIVNYPW